MESSQNIASLTSKTRILAISNAKARRMSKSGSIIEIDKLPENSFHYISQSKSDLVPLIKQAAQNNIEHILIEGGDGTVRTVMSILLNSYADDQNLPAISIVPSGTTNQIASNLGIKKAKDILRICKGETKETTLPLIKIDLEASTQEDRSNNGAQSLYGFLFSTGALPHISRFAQEKFNENGIGGGTAVIGGVLKVVTSDKSRLMPPESHKMTAYMGEKTVFGHEDIVLGTVMTTLPTLMLGLDPFWGDEDAPLRFTWADGENSKLARTIAGLWVGRKRNRSNDGFYSHNVDSLDLNTNAPAVLDGDFINISGQNLLISASRPVRFWQAL